ncbi:TspO/MBR family protein [Amorphus orientalis]|uniref:Tryptophan-rich sensory protein n=1 Tax=Amorphus orientalis TaxID=649198 RepID=A0AAE3VNU0_9HYPH|nr:TspO/MBR family protein [Amorphus orientalis]MDQ0315488.1 tryptophan-rich sensory protein [Amorphus orientalis]
MTLEPYLVLFGFIVACTLVALSGALFRPGPWYERMAKPSWTPPNYVFGPVWTVLYVMIAVSGWLVWRAAGFEGAPVAFAIYGVQLALNALWSAIFFGMRRPGLAIVDVAALWLSILATIVAFYPHSQTAALLLLPYLVWVSIASALNVAVWRLNLPSARVRS